MSEMHSVREMVLNNLLAGKSKEITTEWFITYTHGGGSASLLHVCKPRFWVNSMNGVYADADGKLTKDFAMVVEFIYHLGAHDEACKCKKPVPKMVRNTYRLATLGLKDG